MSGRKIGRRAAYVLGTIIIFAIICVGAVGYKEIRDDVGVTGGHPPPVVIIQSCAERDGKLEVWVQNVGIYSVTLDSLSVNGNLLSSRLSVTLSPGSNTTTPLTAPWNPHMGSPCNC